MTEGRVNICIKGKRDKNINSKTLLYFVQGKLSGAKGNFALGKRMSNMQINDNATTYDMLSKMSPK